MNGYPVWMLVYSLVSDQLDPGRDEGEEEIEGEEEDKEVEQRVPATTMASEEEVSSCTDVCQRDLRAVVEGVQIL